MRLNWKPMSALKTFAAATSMFTMCISPVAQGAQAANQKQLINQFLKDTALSTKKQTVGEYWQRVRHVYPPKLQSQIDEWVKYNRNELMPTVEATTYKASNGTEQVRLNLNMGPGKTMTLAFTGDEDKPLKINTVTLSKKDLNNYNKFNEIVSQLAKDPAIKKSLEVPVEKSAGGSAGTRKFISGRQLATMPIRTQVEYLMRLRLAAEAADRVIDSFAKKPKKGAFFDFTQDESTSYVWSMLMGTPANAVSGACVASGWIASYHNNSCARPNPGRATMLEQASQLPFAGEVKEKIAGCAVNGGLPCNPMIFGFKDNYGNPYCVQSNLNTATNQCDKLAPLPGSKEKIIQSIVAARGKNPSLCKVDGENTVSQACSDALEKYTNSLQQHYLNAAEFCTEGAVANIESRNSWKTRSNIRADQVDACENLKNRFFDLQVEVSSKPPVVIDECDMVATGSTKKDGQCLCPDGSKPRPVTEEKTADSKKGSRKERRAAEPASKPQTVAGSDENPPPPGEGSDVSSKPKMTCESAAAGSDKADKEKEQCGEWSWCKKKGLYIAAGAALIGLGLFWLLFHKNKPKTTTPTYEPPAPVPGPTVSPTTTPVIITPSPNPNPCVAPNTLVNGVCTAPTIVVPQPPDSEGGTTTGTILNGGTR
ncbi:MAG: hypothetical protein ACM3MG_08360 [Bacillota bacterium]